MGNIRPNPDSMQLLSREDHQEVLDQNWNRNIWHLNTAPKVKMFLWKTSKGALPVGERLMARHMDIDPKCKRCGDKLESINHLLFHCSFAKKIRELASLCYVNARRLLDLTECWPELISKEFFPLRD